MRIALKPIKAVTAANMGANVQYIQNVVNYDTVAVQVNYTATSSPVGTIQILGSLDYNPGGYPNNTAPNAGFFAPLYFNVGGSTVNSVAVPGSTSPILINISLLGLAAIKVVYTRTSGGGTDTMDIWVAAKTVGGT